MNFYKCMFCNVFQNSNRNQSCHCTADCMWWRTVRRAVWCKRSSVHTYIHTYLKPHWEKGAVLVQCTARVEPFGQRSQGHVTPAVVYRPHTSIGVWSGLNLGEEGVKGKVKRGSEGRGWREGVKGGDEGREWGWGWGGVGLRGIG